MAVITRKCHGRNYLRIAGYANKRRRQRVLKPGVDFVAATRREVDTLSLKNSPLVFAGFGVVAPEFGWNDYKGLDVKGKTVIVLVNDPGFKAKEKLFKGDTMSYYGRWTYKYEEAARQGAAGVIIIHQTEPASYGWQVIQNSFTGAKLYLQQADKHMNRCKVEGWMSEEAATKLLSQQAYNGDIREYARKKDFKAVALNSTVSLSLKNTLKYSKSHNVIAILKGTERPDETILYTAHWDHFGIGKPDAKGDSIYNGAVDNASGVAAVLAVAKKFAVQKDKPKRSIVFLAVTAEEQGLLGSEYYATHPIYPLNKTVANLNLDALSDFGETSNFSITGKGQNDLDDYVIALTKPKGWDVVGDETRVRAAITAQIISILPKLACLRLTCITVQKASSVAKNLASKRPKNITSSATTNHQTSTATRWIPKAWPKPLT
jgi:Zn-dependent M28 family amino/carboxypeptidase